MRQRLGLAQALLGQPRALLLDEPTTGLDPALRQSFYEILREMRGSGAAILLSSHVLSELEGEVDRVVVMNRGRKMADGSIVELRRLAGIDTRVRLRVPDGVAPGPEALGDWTHLFGGVLEMRCDESRVLGQLRALPDWAEDIEVLRPSLDEIYAAFLRREDGVPREAA
jgi:Cu-processing system ATP-binding protein